MSEKLIGRTAIYYELIYIMHPEAIILASDLREEEDTERAKRFVDETPGAYIWKCENVTRTLVYANDAPFDLYEIKKQNEKNGITPEMHEKQIRKEWGEFYWGCKS